VRDYIIKPHYSTEFIDQILSRVNMMEIMKDHGVQVKAGSGENHYYVPLFVVGKRILTTAVLRRARKRICVKLVVKVGMPFTFCAK
jgi:hypothetical protein